MLLRKYADNAMTQNQRSAYQQATTTPAASASTSARPNWLTTEFKNLGTNMASVWNSKNRPAVGDWLQKTWRESPVLTSAAAGLGLAGTGYAVQRVLQAGAPRAFQQYQAPQPAQQSSILPWLGIGGLAAGGMYLWNRYGDRVKNIYNKAMVLDKISPDLEVLGDLAHSAQGNKAKLLWNYFNMPDAQKQRISNAITGLEQLRSGAPASAVTASAVDSGSAPAIKGAAVAPTAAATGIRPVSAREAMQRLQ